MQFDGNVLVNNIRALCKKQNVSVSKLESDLFLSPGLISRWGRNMPALDKVLTIAEYLGVSVDDLVGRPKSNLNSTNIERLLALLYNRSMMAEIDWDILNFQNPPKQLTDIAPSDLFESGNYSCYFSDYKNGFFLMAAAYSLNDNLLLKLFTLPDVHSKPECICTDVNMLRQLYEYLDHRFSRKLNSIKSDNFINAFLEDTVVALPPADSPIEFRKTPLRDFSNAINY